MAKVTVHAGDWAKGGEHMFMFGSFSLRPHGGWSNEGIPASNLSRLEVASEENVKRLGGAVGWGAVGALALGPVGLLAGLLGGGNKKDVTFVAEFQDGRKMLATTDSKAFTKMQAAVFEKVHSPPVQPAPVEAVTYKASPSEMTDAYIESSASIRAMTVQSFPHLTEEELDRYEYLLRHGLEGEAAEFLRERQFEADVKEAMVGYCFTEEEARYFHTHLQDPLKDAEIAELMRLGFSRMRA